jgi:hypothetical protein
MQRQSLDLSNLGETLEYHARAPTSFALDRHADRASECSHQPSLFIASGHKHVYKKAVRVEVANMFPYIEVLMDLSVGLLLVVLSIWFLRSHDHRHPDPAKTKKKSAT